VVFYNLFLNLFSRMNASSKYLLHFLPTARFCRILGLLVLSAGILLRLVIWWQQRPIFLDEANLIRNYVERSYGGLFQDLGYEQYAPPLFSVIVKACIQLVGNNELATRLFPLICSIATLLLFYRLSRRFLGMPASVAATAFVAFGHIFIDYATECKQYATDGLITLLLLELTFRLRPPKGIGRSTFGWGLIGAIAIWFSMPSVFVLAGIGLFWLVQGWQAKGKHAVWGTVLAGTCWVISFAVYFILLIRHNAQSDYLQQYHKTYFLAFPPKSIPEWQLLLDQLERICKKAIGKTAIAKILTGIALVAAVREMVVRRKEIRSRQICWLLLVPILFCFAASALHYYSLLARLTLFFLPLLILLVFVGLESLAKNRLTARIIAILVVVILSNQEQFSQMNKPFHSDYAEVRDGLKFIASRQQPGEVLIASDDVLPVVRYYTQHHQSQVPLRNVDLKRLGYGNMVEVKLDSLRRLGYRNIWVVASVHDQVFAAMAAQQDRVLERKDYFYSYVLLYKIQ
jgi:hypothetical protein